MRRRRPAPQMDFVGWRSRALAPPLPDRIRNEVLWAERRFDRCESDLERMFVVMVTMWWNGLSNVSYRGECPPGRKLAGRNFLVDLDQQVKVADYRCDFMLSITALATGKIRRVAIECDGHSFHDRTPEQASADRRRDRALIALGISTLRYTFSDLTRDPNGSMRDLYLTVRAIALDFCGLEKDE